MAHLGSVAGAASLPAILVQTNLQRGAHGPTHRQSRAIRSRRLRRHRRSRLPQALSGAVSSRAKRTIHRADAHHRRFAPPSRPRRISRYGEGRADQIQRHRRRRRRGDGALPVAPRLCRRDATGDSGWADLKALLGPDERIRAYYLATSPDLFCPLANRLGDEGLVDAALAHHRREADRQGRRERGGDQR